MGELTAVVAQNLVARTGCIFGTMAPVSSFWRLAVFHLRTVFFFSLVLLVGPARLSHRTMMTSCSLFFIFVVVNSPFSSLHNYDEDNVGGRQQKKKRGGEKKKKKKKKKKK